MKDVEYAIKVLNSKVYGLRDAMVDNATVYKKFVKEVHKDFDILRRRVTRLERRETADRLAIYVLIFKIWRMDAKLQESGASCKIKTRATARKMNENPDICEDQIIKDIAFEG